MTEGADRFTRFIVWEKVAQAGREPFEQIIHVVEISGDRSRKSIKGVLAHYRKKVQAMVAEAPTLRRLEEEVREEEHHGH